MKSFALRYPLLAGAGLLGLLLGGCQSSPANQPVTMLPRHENVAAGNWISRRTLELEHSGLKAAEAAQKAQQEWNDRNFDQADSYVLYDSAAKARADQEKFEDTLGRMQRGE